MVEGTTGSESATPKWVATEISHGRFQLESEKYRIEVFADFSGQVTDVYGYTMAFDDLRTFIEAADLLKQALIDHYGGWR